MRAIPDTLHDTRSQTDSSHGGVPQAHLALAIVWSADEPWRVGEVALVPARASRCVIGRGEQPSALGVRLLFMRDRPLAREPTGGLGSPYLSREQLMISSDGALLSVESVGRAPLLIDGVEAVQGLVGPGSVLELGRQLMLLVVKREPVAAPASFAPFPFGQPDAHGIVGESSVTWALRAAIQRAARAGDHVLVIGPSGSGKELVARAIHAESQRASRAFVARSAVTFPESLVDAELFGNARGYPNPGMSERLGLVGEADGGTLFLDEIGELPPSLQAHLLRLLDGGEYTRLGETRARRADLRVVAATNRSERELKHDFAARFGMRIDVAGLSVRGEDVPLLILELARRSNDPLTHRFLDAADGRAFVRCSRRFVRALVRHGYATHVRELVRLLRLAAHASDGTELQLTEAVAAQLGVGASFSAQRLNDTIPPTAGLSSRSLTPATPIAVPTEEPTSEADSVQVAEIQRVLDATNGSIEDAFRLLGMSSRHVLTRLIKKYGIVVSKRAKR